MNEIRTIRRAHMLRGVELENKNGKIILPQDEPNFNEVELVNVLKESAGKPVWWSDAGINWMWYYADTMENAISLYEAVTGATPRYSDEISEWRGAYAFRIHM